MNYEQMENCPVCKKRMLKRAIKIHIINAGKAECWRRMNSWLDYAKNKPSKTSPAVWLRTSSHLAYWRRNQKLIKKFRIKNG